MRGAKPANPGASATDASAARAELFADRTELKGQQFLLTKEIRDEIRRRVNARDDLSKSQLARDAFTEYFNNHPE